MPNESRSLTAPIPLVQTWCLLLRHEDDEISTHAKEMLLNTFGNMRAVLKFVKKHKIRV
ncbi:hypothetical protein [uncultured Paraglaciecola sp.]|uniref:hypothetical protein n=1 Tax=uncultured Paraglaciecola sp. TaxID=1765024 RepID=UPI0025941915|nr:hypothetical protein [uncultured Paraglaciecola sp.]